MKKLSIAFLVVAFAAIISAVIGMWLEQPPRVHAASTFGNILCDNFKPVSTTANAQIITAGGPTQFIYVCSYNLTIGTAETVSMVEGTGATCGTGTAAMVGGTTAAAGVSIGSINYGGGSGVVTRTVTAGDNVCLLKSGAGTLAGVVGWTSQPF